MENFTAREKDQGGTIFAADRPERISLPKDFVPDGVKRVKETEDASVTLPAKGASGLTARRPHVNNRKKPAPGGATM